MRPENATMFCIIVLFLPGIAAHARADGGSAGVITEQASETNVVHNDNRTLSTAIDPGGYQRLSGNQRWDLYLHNAFWSPGVFFRAAGPALGGQLSNEPPAWGQGAEGYSKRFANRFGRFTLKETYEAAGAAALGHEVRYIRSERNGFLPRAAHALSANFLTYDRNGRRAPHFARVGSVVAAEFTGNLWMPHGYREASTAMRGVGIELGVSTGINLMREFAPELKRIFTRK